MIVMIKRPPTPYFLNKGHRLRLTVHNRSIRTLLKLLPQRRQVLIERRAGFLSGHGVVEGERSEGRDGDRRDVQGAESQGVDAEGLGEETGYGGKEREWEDELEEFRDEGEGYAAD